MDHLDKFKDIVYYTDKNNQICSMGMRIESSMDDNPVYMLNCKKKTPFRNNLGIPLPLFLLKKESKNLLDIINYDSKNSLKHNFEVEEEEKCIDESFFNKLINLASKNKKNKSKTQKNKPKKNKNKTRKKKN